MTVIGIAPMFLTIQRKWTPLFAAAWRGHVKIVQYLVEEKGCDPAVMTAVSSSYVGVVIN